MGNDSKSLKVLLSAYACEPGKGSEPGVGWNIAKELSSRVSLWVITRANNREAIETSGEEWIRQVQWIYWDPPKWLTFWKKGGRGVQLFYAIWQFGVKAVAERTLASQDFDIIHHVTFGKYWIPSRLAALPRPFVFGPVGGGECSPPGLATSSSLRGRIAEIGKNLAIAIVTRIPGIRTLYRSAAWTFAATSQTENALRQLGVTRMSVLPQSGITPSDLPRIDIESHSARRNPGELLLVTAARLIHWKAIDLAIEAMAVANLSCPTRLVILQTGPEMERLKSLARQLGIEQQVEFKGRLPHHEDVCQEIARADALVHPALHEAFGQACLEALALGTPVICLKWAGPGIIVDSTSGFAIEPSDRNETIKRLADAMVSIHREKQAGKSRKDCCMNRAFGAFAWSDLGEKIMNLYQDVINCQMADSNRY